MNTLPIHNSTLKNNHKWHRICPKFFPLFLNDFDTIRKRKTYAAWIRLYTFWNTFRNYVLEAIQTSTVCNFVAFCYLFIVNVGLYKECEFARSKHHQKFKKNHALDWERTKILKSVCSNVLFVLDSKKTQVLNVFPIKISVFSAAAVIEYR